MYRLLLVLLIVTGCARYSATPLTTPAAKYIQKVPSNQNLLVAAKALNKRECKRALDRNVIKQGYQPVQLYIENNSDKSYFFSTTRVSLKLANPEDVAEKVHTSTLGRILGYSAAAVIATPLFIIPAVVDGYNSTEANDALDDDFAAKSPKNLVIAPYSEVNILLFVPRANMEESISFTLLEKESHLPQRVWSPIYR